MKEKIIKVSKNVLAVIGGVFVFIMLVGAIFGEEVKTIDVVEAPTKVELETPVEKETPVEEEIKDPYKDPKTLIEINSWCKESSLYSSYLTETCNIMSEYGSNPVSLSTGAKTVIEQGILDEAITHHTNSKDKNLPEEVLESNNYYLECYTAFKTSMEYTSSGNFEKGTEYMYTAIDYMNKGTEKLNEANLLMSE